MFEATGRTSNAAASRSNSALHDPRDLAPLSCEREPPPEADVIIDPSIRAEPCVPSSAARNFKLEKINQALGQIRIMHDKDGTTRITRADGEVPAESSYAMRETQIRSLENSIGRELPWMYSLLPTRLDTIARKSFLRKLQVIRKHRIATLEPWQEYELKRL